MPPVDLRAVCLVRAMVLGVRVRVWRRGIEEWRADGGAVIRGARGR